jgi:hypothetical protein
MEFVFSRLAFGSPVARIVRSIRAQLRRKMGKSLRAIPVLLLLFAPAILRADTLLDLLNPPNQRNTPYSLTFVAGAATTTISFEGYQVPANESATDISLTTGASANLLGRTWIFTPAASDSDAAQFNDGFNTGTNGLILADRMVGSFDMFDQVINTRIGQAYDLSFIYFNDLSFAGPSPSAFIVSASNASPVTGAVPEPPAATLLCTGLLGLLALAAPNKRHAPCSY